MDQLLVSSSDSASIGWGLRPSLGRWASPRVLARCLDGSCAYLYLIWLCFVSICSCCLGIVPSWHVKPFEKLLLPLLFELIWLIFEQVGSCGRVRLAWANGLFGRYFRINSASFRLKIRNTCGLPTVIVVEQIIPLHELLCIDFDQRAVHWNSAKVDGLHNGRGEGLATSWTYSLVFIEAIPFEILELLVELWWLMALELIWLEQWLSRFIGFFLTVFYLIAE